MKMIALSAGLVLLTASAAAQDGTSGSRAGTHAGEMREALKIYDAGMYSRARRAFEETGEKMGKSDPAGYSVLCDIRADVPGARQRMEAFINADPYSVLVPQMRYALAMNLFDRQEYKEASEYFAFLNVKDVPKNARPEFLFKKAYSAFESRDWQAALEGFKAVDAMPQSDFTAPSRYAAGYIEYSLKNFKNAEGWFLKSQKDKRFSRMSSYYIAECRFMCGDYGYVTSNADALYESVPEERRPHLARIISESYLVLGDADNARRFYGYTEDDGGVKSRADWFYSGSVLYAVSDYKGAIDAFNRMGERKDSIGQVASYHLGYSYIQTKDKVSAMQAFKDASALPYDSDMAEDAYFNWAKLAFDLNNDPSVFNDYLKKYSELERGDRINSYIAVAALHNRDYEGAVDAYDKIDELDDDMRLNYMKANYLRANQLIGSGSYRKAIPCLKVAAYYSEKGSRFNQLARFWLAESYYRNDQFPEAREVFSALYNTSALYGMPESYLLTYNIAYCHYKEGNYPAALKWFTEYLGEKSVKYRKEALERQGDCHFMARDYAAASASYDKVLKEYFDCNDIYPYYQDAISYGLDNNSARKIELLSNVLKASPQAKFYPEAMFELGRTYVLHERDDEAFDCFRRLASNVKDSTFVARAYIEMGTLSRNQSQFNDALGYYRKVVEEMPLSGYADDALLAMESIYQARNEPEAYIAYIEKIGKGATKTEDEKESMIFNSAEQIFLSENYEKAIVSLQSYLSKYPAGANVFKAEFYMAESYRHLGKYEQACDTYRKVINDGEGSFVEISMLNFSDLSYRLEKWSDAFGGYASLYETARLDNNRYTALVGMMRSAYRGHDWANAVKNADRVMAESRTVAAMKSEARYVKAKSCLAVSRRDDAFAILRELAGDCSDRYGAEAAYMLIQDSYDRGDFADVETRVYAFADSGSDQTYWLAKSFIILGDSFVERDELEQAKATFESVRDGYEPSGPDDDVPANVEMRLKKLDELLLQ